MTPLDKKIIGQSPAAIQLKKMIALIAPSDAPAIIFGATGSGKELVAEALHEESRRKGRFVTINCAAIPKELIEAEIFGFEKGAFTGAVKSSIGKFDQAQKGTLFLDEIGDMSLSAQAKVLRALQENKITRVGGNKSIIVKPRVIAATTVMMVVFSIVPFFLTTDTGEPVMSEVYLYTAIASGILMVVLSAWVVSKPTEQASWVLFKFSSPYLAVLFIALMVDSAL